MKNNLFHSIHLNVRCCEQNQSIRFNNICLSLEKYSITYIRSALKEVLFALLKLKVYSTGDPVTENDELSSIRRSGRTG